MVHSLISFALLFMVFVPLERVFAARRQRILRREFWTDCAFFFGQYWLWMTAVVTLLSALGGLLEGGLLVGLRTWVASQPVWLQAIEIVLLGDLLIYWGHRLAHRFDFLWRFHRVHHTAETLDWVAAYREHPLDGLYTQLLVNLPSLVCGFSVSTIAGVAAFRGMWGVFIHSNVDIPLGPLKYVLGSPRLHHWHHEIDSGDHVNFANMMPVMDLLFGTFYEPGVEPERYGVPEPVPHGYLGQLLYPLGLWPKDRSVRALRRLAQKLSSTRDYS